MTDRPKLIVGIPCHNGAEYIRDLLLSLGQGEVKPDLIIVVDNGSNDRSAEIVRNEFPEVKLLQYKESLGYAKASNLCLKEALKQNPDYILLLNQDIICKKDTLKELVSFANKCRNFFILSPLILCDSGFIQTSGDILHFLGFGYSGNYKLPLCKFKLSQLAPLEMCQPISINLSTKTWFTYASGAAMFFCAKSLKKVGMFDEDFIMYHEDSDISLRARLLGEKIFLVPKAHLIHRYNPTITHFRWYWSERNRILILIKFYKLPTLILIFPLFIFMEIGVIGFSFLDGWLDLKMKSYRSILSVMDKILKKRKDIQKKRKLSDKEFLKCFSSTFNFAGVTHPLLKYIVNPVFGILWKILYFFIFW